MKLKALITVIAVGLWALSCGGPPPPEPQPPEPQPQPDVQPTPAPTPAPAPAAAASLGASPDQDPQTVDHKCHLCEMLATDCAAAGRSDCGGLQADCMQKCQTVKAAAGSPQRGSPCSSDGDCGSGLCCRMGKCGLNQMFYQPFTGESLGGEPGKVGVYLQCQ
jgi:hypothetical protein